MNAETLAEKIYDFLHTDKAWTVFWHSRKWEDRSITTKARYIKLAEFIIKEMDNG